MTEAGWLAKCYLQSQQPHSPALLQKNVRSWHVLDLPYQSTPLIRYDAHSEPGARMRRREFLGVLGGAAACPLAARAQLPTLPVIGFLDGWSPEGFDPYVAAFKQGLSETGYVEGKRVAIEYR